MTTSREFLALLFGHESLAGLYLTIWDRQTKSTAAFQLPGVDQAAMEAERRCNDRDVYFGVCPYSKIGQGSRGVAEDAAALVGHWADIDVQGPAHKLANLPPTREAAFDLVYECAHPPSVVVSSGYGIQAWWLFRKPFLIRDEASRKEAAGMASGWVDHVRGKASRHGWQVDPVGDLARVLRVPGTKNHKQDEARPVEVMR